MFLTENLKNLYAFFAANCDVNRMAMQKKFDDLNRNNVNRRITVLILKTINNNFKDICNNCIYIRT